MCAQLQSRLLQNAFEDASGVFDCCFAMVHLPCCDKEFAERRILYTVYGKSGYVLVHMFERWLSDG